MDVLARCLALSPGDADARYNRALLLAGLAKGMCRVTGLLHSDDTQVMTPGMQALGASFAWEDDGAPLAVTGNGGVFARPTQPLDLSNAGTATRFLITVATLLKPSEESEEEGKEGGARKGAEGERGREGGR